MRRSICIVSAGLLGLAIVVALAGCATSEPAGVGCPRLSPWSSEDQKELKAAYGAEPKGSILRRAVDDLLYMRDQSRACAGRR